MPQSDRSEKAAGLWKKRKRLVQDALSCEEADVVSCRAERETLDQVPVEGGAVSRAGYFG
ncbi:MAG: hypothetical protein V1800_04780 [Candidatus Latescibacterota bacterium]